MVLGWRRAFCTSIPRNEEKQQSPSPKLSSRFGFFSSSSAPSTPRSHSRPISGPTGSNLRCRTRAAVPAESPKVEQECKSTMKSPRFFSFSNPSSPRSPSTFSSFLKSKVIEEKTRSTNTIDHVDDENKRSQKPILKVYNDDEPLMSPTSIPESEEENNDYNFVEVRGFFLNAANTCRNAIGVSLSPEAAAVSGDNYVVVLKVKAPAKTARRAPIDLVVVLDVSGKMTSEKLQMMKRAMRLVISSLSAADRLSIVAFSTASKRLLPLRKMTVAGRRSARRIVDAVVALDGTAATATDALKKAVKVLEDRRDRNPAASIMLLSDEQYHSSATASASASASQKLRPFVCSTRFSHLEIPVHSVALSAFEHAPHEDLFTKSISDLLSVVVQDLKIQLGFISGSNRDKIAAVYSHIGRPTALGSGSIRLGELYAEEERELLVELKVPSSAAIGSHRVLSVKYSYKDPSTQELINCKEQAFLVPCPHAVKSATSKRLRNLFITTRAVAEARRLVERNELAGAHHMLASARALFLQSGSGSGSGSGDEFVNGLEAELRELHLRRQNQVRQSPRQKMYVERDGFAYVDEKGEPLTPTSAWRAAEMLAKLAVTRKSLNRVSDLHGFENARF